MHSWHWRTWNDLPYLTCSLLEPWRHGFFTQQYAPRLPDQLTPILAPTAQTYRVKQVHGNLVLAASDVEVLRSPTTPKQAPIETSELEPPPADGLVTERAEQAVWVCSADCTPVLIGDLTTGLAAAVHAGWRGTAQKIVPQAIARMQAQGSQLADLRIAMGPAISGEMYQVSEQVAAEVGASIIPVDPANLTAALAALHQLENSPILDDTVAGRVRLDVRRVNALQLEQLGISPEHVAIAPHCTYQDPDHFFSYRRQRQKKAQWSGIVSGLSR